jgi:hypothetical protein
MKGTIYNLLKRSPARYVYNGIRTLLGGASQSNEAAILAALVGDSCPRTFVEFGFHPGQYNCIRLKDFSGLLIDGDPETVRLARAILPKRIEVLQQFLTLENLRAATGRYPEIGVLSIDVDGNDYWFLEALLPTRPHIVAVEYNASFLGGPLTVPYDAAFERHRKHASGWYHGASLSALSGLCDRHGFKLVAVAEDGTNAFFVPKHEPMPALDPSVAYRENALRNRWSNTTAAQQWTSIKHLPFVEV